MIKSFFYPYILFTFSLTAKSVLTFE